MIKKIIFSFKIVSLISVFSLNAAETIKGTVADKSSSFDFNINSPVLTTFTSRGATVSILFTSAAATPSNAEFTIARSSSINPFAGEPFLAMSPESATVNGEEAKPNPIRGVATSHLTLFGNRLALRLETKPAQVFVQGNIFGTPSNAQIVTMRNVNINDAAGATSSGVAALATNSDKFVFAAVAPNGGADIFGGADSGIALVKLDADKVPINGNPDKEKLIPFLDVLNATNGTKKGNLAVRFDVTTSQLRIGSDLASIADVVDMHWDDQLKRLYIVTTATSAADGVRAVVIGRLLEDTLIFDEIAPIGVFSGTDQIVGATGAATVSLSHVKTMHTTTGLSYLIVAGNNGVSSTTGNVLFAVPLVDKSNNNKDFNTDSTHGTLADVTVNPQTFFAKGFFKARAFTTAATAPGDVLTNSSAAAMIGAGALHLLASSRISDLFVTNDAVFAAIKTDYDGGTTEPGLYKSQAIFDQNGVITAWTAWKRVAGTDALIQGAAVDERSNSFVYLTTNAGGTVSDTMKRTLWSAGDSSSGAAGLATLLSDNFKKVNGGVQGLFDFPRDTPTFIAMAGEQLSLLVSTGLGKITFIETARDEGLDFKPFFGSYSGITSSFTNGTIGTTFVAGGSTRAIVMSGGAIADLGPISAAEVATDGSEGFLAIGGVGGLAILVTPAGAGWSSLTDGFGGLTSGMKFFEVGDYSFVRKLISDGTNLYVLTNKTFDRIDMATSNFATGVLAVETLATPESIGLAANDSFSDASVSGEVGLLATSQGLFRVGNGQDVSSGSSTTLDWTQVSVPNAPGPATRLTFGTTTGMNQDFGANGQLYLLAAYNGFNQAQLNRYIINFHTTVDDNTVQLVPDLILKSPTFLMTFGAFRNFLLDDGALVTATRSRNNMPTDDPFLDPVTGLTQEPEQKREAFVKFTQNEPVAQEQIKVPFNLETTSNIANTVRSVASGAILVPGDFGLRVND